MSEMPEGEGWWLASDGKYYAPELHPDFVKPPPPPPPAAPFGNGTVSQQNALKSATNYLSVLAFSRSGLIDQLKHEGFNEADAIFGVDALDADWNAQAAYQAAKYLLVSAFSHSGLVTQLLHEGYSQEQAEYGVSTTGL
jgi:hypothetical protein